MSNKTGKRQNHIWEYFAKFGESARCSMCNKILKVSQRSIKGLKCHLKSKHGIFVITSRTSAPIRELESSASIDDSLKMDDRQSDIEDLSTPIPIKKIKIRNTSDNIKEHRKKNGIWKYFTKTGENARCSMCYNILKISQRSTTGLKCHLKSKHGIDIVTSRTPAPVQRLEPSTLKDDSTINKEAKLSNSIDTYVTKEYSKERMISRLVAKDGLTFESLSASEDLKYLFLKSGFSLPTDTNSIKSIVENFAQTVRAEMSIKLQNLKIHGAKFSMTFDEWASSKNKRYLNVNVHYSGTYFNVGLIKIHDSCNAEDYIKLIKTRLELFGLHLDTDIIGITTDDTSVMKKVNSLISCYPQFCFAHAIQLAVVETLYNAPSKESVSCFIKDEEVDPLGCSDDDNDSFDEETSEEQLMSVTYLEKSAVQLIPDYRYLINKVRQTVKIFRKYPAKYTCLQKYIRKYLQKESNLILDSKISWSSLFSMLERFHILRGSISKTLIDVGSEIKFSDQEWAKIKELILSLEPLKLGVEVLCRRDSTLLTADTTLRFILNKLDKLEGEVSTDLAIALRMRIKERRTDLSGICIYLHNPKKYENCLANQDNIFSVPKKSCIRLEIQKICERMLPMTWNVDHTIIKSENIEDQEITINGNLSLQEELEMQLTKETRNASNVNMMAQKNTHFEKNIKIEMAEFESSGIRGKYLSLVHNYLNTITPTSIEAEKAFSVTGYICSPIRRGIPDKTIDAISFLRSYFQNES